MKSDLIILTETWLEDNQDLDDYKLPDYKENFIIGGRGKGIASYHNKKFAHRVDMKEEGFSISMFQKKDLMSSESTGHKMEMWKT